MQFCNYPTCSKLLSEGGYCSKHLQQSPSKIADDNRGNSNARGYDYRWRQFRESYLREHPLCADCAAKGIVTVATEIHHIQKLALHPELKYDDDNLLCLCHRCHSVRTANNE